MDTEFFATLREEAKAAWPPELNEDERYYLRAFWGPCPYCGGEFAPRTTEPEPEQFRSAMCCTGCSRER